jgi:hypothetical protein
MRRSFRRAASDVRTVIMVVAALAGGVLLYRAVAGAWMKTVVASALRASNEDITANWKSVEVPGMSSFSADDVSRGVVFDNK